MKQPLVKDTLKLFIKFQNSFDSYVQNQKDKESLFNISGNLLTLLHEIVQSNATTTLIITNSTSRQENRQKRIEKEKRKKNEGVSKDQDKEKDIIKFKRAKNVTSFNQRSIQTINHFYHSINELMIIKEMICDSAFEIAKSAIEEAIEMKYGKIDKVSNFILRRQVLKKSDRDYDSNNMQMCKKAKQAANEGYNNKPNIPKRFISFNDYLRQGRLGLEMSQYDLLMKTNLLLKDSSHPKNKPGRLDTEPNAKSKIHLPAISSLIINLKKKEDQQQKSQSFSKTPLNFTQFPMEANMNIKYRLDNRLAITKKNNLSLNQRNMQYTSAFDYGKVFTSQNNKIHITSKSSGVKKRTLKVHN